MSHQTAPAQIIKEAETWVGTPYRHQAGCKQVGTDCLGFIYGLYAHFFPYNTPPVPPYEVYPHTGEGEILWHAAKQYLVEVSLPCPVPGSVLLFRMRTDLPARHLGVLAKDGFLIHAAHGRGVVKSRFGKWWRRRLIGIFSFPPIDEQQDT